MAILPPYLKKGDTIGIVCPAGYMPFANAETCIETLHNWGFKTKIGRTLGSQFHYFSGTDEERLQDLQQMLDDDSVKAVLCGRGGYGISKIIDQLNFKRFKKQPKWVIGFSDITAFHLHVYNRFNIASMHAPMAAAFNNGEHDNEFVQSLRKVLLGKKAKYTAQSNACNKPGSATGELVGGNLSLIAHCMGTPSEIKMKGNILFIEDIGEYVYNVDRMLCQLQRSGKLHSLAGMIVGHFTDMKDTTIPFGCDVQTVIKNAIDKYGFPVCFGFPVSHDRENVALKVGGKYKLKVGLNKVTLAEQ